jgi:hypothetical protein
VEHKVYGTQEAGKKPSGVLTIKEAGMKKAIVLFILASVYGCAGRPTPIPDPDSPDAKLYVAKCILCHSVPHPGRHTYEQWEHMIEVMEKQMEHKTMAPLTVEEKAAILEYLKGHSR